MREARKKSLGVSLRDADSDPLSAILVAGPANGMLVLNADGSFDYTPDADFNGTDCFTYEASDGSLSDTATATGTSKGCRTMPLSLKASFNCS